MIPTTPYLDQNPKIKKSLIYSIIDGVFYSIKVGLGANSISPYAVFLKATDTQLALLGTLPQVLGSIIQLVSHHLILWLQSRRFVVALGASLQAITFFPILLIYFCNPNGRVSYLILCAIFYNIFGNIITPIWNSWIGDLVPDEIRGAYFGTRNRIMEIATFSSMILGGFIIKTCENYFSNIYLGFAFVFSIALIARFVSAYFLKLKYDPSYTPLPTSENTFVKFLQLLPKSNYGSFVLFMCLINFSIYTSTTYTTKFLIDELNVSYFLAYIILAIGTISKCLVLPYWGQICDEFGTRKVLVLSGFLMPLAPILWCFNGPIWYFILAQIYSGFVWAGFELSVFNIFFDMIDRDHRLKYISYYNVINGMAIFLGGLFGAFARSHFLLPYTSLFVISGLMRYAIYFIFIRKIHEVRTVQNISSPKLLIHLFSKMKPSFHPPNPPKKAA